MGERHLRVESILGTAPRVWLVDEDGIEVEGPQLAEANVKTSWSAFGADASCLMEVNLTFKGAGSVHKAGEATAILIYPSDVSGGK